MTCFFNLSSMTITQKFKKKSLTKQESVINTTTSVPQTRHQIYNLLIIGAANGDLSAKKNDADINDRFI